MQTYLRRHVWWKVTALYVAICFVAMGASTHQAHSENLTPETTTRLSASTEKEAAMQDTPVRIIIPSVSLNLKVVPGFYNSQQQTWSVSDVAANFATNTYMPNDRAGTTLIYGHDREALFHKIKKLRSNDVVVIQTKKGHSFTYTYDENSSHDLQPNDTSLFSNLKTTRPKLVLMTCDGLWSQQRWIMSFSFKEAK